MRSLIRQIVSLLAISSKMYGVHLRCSIPALISVLLTTFVLSFFLSVSNGLRESLDSSDSESAFLILRAGSEIEALSSVSQLEVNLLQTFISSQSSVDVILSPEIYLPIAVRTIAEPSLRSLPLRGIGPNSITTRPRFSIASGRMSTVGSNEVIVGVSLANSLGIQSGENLLINDETWLVSGTFDLGGSLYESEIWTSIGSARALIGGSQAYQSVRVFVSNDSSPEIVSRLLESHNSFMSLRLMSVSAFYSEQVNPSIQLINTVTIPIFIFLGIGATVALFVSTQTSITARFRELVIFHRLGFTKLSISISLVIENVLICCIAGGIGTVLSYLIFDGYVTSTAGLGLIVTVFELSTSSAQLFLVLAAAILIGIAGTILPSRRILYSKSINLNRD